MKFDRVSRTLHALTLILAVTSTANAQSLLIKPDQAYAEAKAYLTNQGWQPVENFNIQNSSLYAQDVYALGFTEVLDCISMERDACLFRYSKGKQLVEVKTFGKDLKVDSYRLIKATK